jgi:hypothetical protein
MAFRLSTFFKLEGHRIVVYDNSCFKNDAWHDKGSIFIGYWNEWHMAIQNDASLDLNIQIEMINFTIGINFANFLVLTLFFNL